MTPGVALDDEARHDVVQIKKPAFQDGRFALCEWIFTPVRHAPLEQRNHSYFEGSSIRYYAIDNNVPG
eukprot:scaffold145222_cov21-Prasinocladus_malaysianus.AAC.1